MRKFWVHYSYAKGKKHVRVIMEAESYRAIITAIRKVRKDAVIHSIKDTATISPETILTLTGA